jgi:hypothetical protein
VTSPDGQVPAGHDPAALKDTRPSDSQVGHTGVQHVSDVPASGPAVHDPTGQPPPVFGVLRP